MLDEYGLTLKQRAFCDYYIQSGNATEAALKAGYSRRSASEIGKQNLKKHPCKQYIAMRMQPKEKRRIADADEVLDYLSGVMRGEIKDQFGLDASLQDRTKAAQELLKRYAVADQRQQSTMQRLDAILMTFNAALQEAPAMPKQEQEAAPETSESTASDA